RVGGYKELIEEHTGRQRCLIDAVGGAAVHIVSTSRFVTGLGREHPIENGFAWHPILGTPYLPGSSLKGMVRAWARALGDKQSECVDSVLGTPGHVGLVAFLDAIPVEPVQLDADVMTPHY